MCTDDYASDSSEEWTPRLQKYHKSRRKRARKDPRVTVTYTRKLSDNWSKMVYISERKGLGGLGAQGQLGIGGTTTQNSIRRIFKEMNRLTPEHNKNRMMFVDIGASRGIQIIRAKEHGYHSSIGYETDKSYMIHGSLPPPTLELVFKDVCTVEFDDDIDQSFTAVHFFTFWQGMDADVQKSIYHKLLAYAHKNSKKNIIATFMYSGHDLNQLNFKEWTKNSHIDPDSMEMIPLRNLAQSGGQKYQGLIVDMSNSAQSNFRTV